MKGRKEMKNVNEEEKYRREPKLRNGPLGIIIIIIYEFVYRNNLSACQACCYR